MTSSADPHAAPPQARPAGPDFMCVMPWVNLHVATSGAISPFLEMPASKMPRPLPPPICQTDMGTPICEFQLFGLRQMLKSGERSWKSHCRSN